MNEELRREDALLDPPMSERLKETNARDDRETEGREPDRPRYFIDRLDDPLRFHRRMD